MTVRDAGWVRPEPLGSIVLGLPVRVTSVNSIFMENRKLVWGDCGSPSSFSSLGFTGRQMSPQVTDCTLETGLQAPLVFQQDPCSVGSMGRWQKLSHQA